MKKNILTIMMTLLFTSSAFAGHCPIGVDDNTIIQGLDIISEEINSFVHSEKAMKKSYKKLCRIEKILKRDRSMNCRALPAEITDADLLQFIDDIAQEINDNDHRRRKLFFTSIKLNRLNRLLVKRRTAPQVDDVAVLEINGADPFNIGATLLGTTLSATFTVTNSGTADATAVVGSVLAPFSFRGGSYPGTGGTCGAVINSGQACTIVLEFTPTVVGPAAETLEIGYDNGVEADLVTKELQGTGI